MRKYNQKSLVFTNSNLWLDRLYICTFVENEDLNKGIMERKRTFGALAKALKGISY